MYIQAVFSFNVNVANLPLSYSEPFIFYLNYFSAYFHMIKFKSRPYQYIPYNVWSVSKLSYSDWGWNVFIRFGRNINAVFVYLSS